VKACHSKTIMDAREAMNISPESLVAVSEEDDLRRRCCTPSQIYEDDYRHKDCCIRRVRCCLFCGPVTPRWKRCSICLVIGYFVACPVIFFLMHFLQYPGNFQGDFHINGTVPFNFEATRSDGKHMLGNRVACPVPPNSKQAPVIFFGGNAQGMSGAAEDALWLLGNMFNQQNSFQFQLFTTAYRGYAPNSGFVSQPALTKDAEDFLDHVLNVTNGSHNGKVILGGWSMGSGVAMQLAAARPERIAGLIVFSPWSSLKEESINIAVPLSYLLYPWIWLSWTWDSVAAMASLPAEIPVAVVSAGNDKVIPNWEHRKVFASSNAKRKWLLETPSAGHADLALEVTSHIDDLKEWTQAAWDRVQVFSPATHNGSAQPYVLPARGIAFDVFGDALTQVHESLFI